MRLDTNLNEEERIRNIHLAYNWKSLDKNLRYLIHFIKRRLRKDWDIVIAMSGEEGSGKSTCGGLIAALIDKNFNLIDNMALLPDEKQIVSEYMKLKKYQCYVIDEAVRAFYKMSFMSKMTQTLVRMWATERYQNKATILIIPRFTDLVENFRNHRVKLWIHVIARGRALVYIRDDDPHNNDPWSINYARTVKKRYNAKKNLSLLTIEERVSIEKKLPNFLFEFKFPDYTPEFKKAYQKLKVKSRDILTEQKLSTEEKKTPDKIRELKAQKDLLIYKLTEEGTTGRKEISKTFDMTLKQVKNSIERAKKVKEEQLQSKKTEEDITGVHRLLETALEIEKHKNKVGG